MLHVLAYIYYTFCRIYYICSGCMYNRRESHIIYTRCGYIINRREYNINTLNKYKLHISVLSPSIPSPFPRYCSWADLKPYIALWDRELRWNEKRLPFLPCWKYATRTAYLDVRISPYFVNDITLHIYSAIAVVCNDLRVVVGIYLLMCRVNVLHIKGLSVVNVRTSWYIENITAAC